MINIFNRVYGMAIFQDSLKKVQFLTKILKRKKVFPSSIACLWVSSSSWLDQFGESQSTRWTVTHKQYLHTMKEQYPLAKLYAHSLLSFRFPMVMQLIYALDSQFESIWWLKNREKVLKKSFDHLEPFGILLFDLSMPKAFDIKSAWKQVKMSENEVIIETTSLKKWLLTKKITSFTRNAQWAYDRHDQTIKQQLLSMSDLKKLLKPFETVEFLDHNGRKATTKTKHVVVVAQKGW